MLNDPSHKYRAFPSVPLPERRWPERALTAAPIWCSVDLRDGNQALIEPMDGACKLRVFRELVRIGFKEIEIGFPSASDTDYGFVRHLIEENEIPDDVIVQVLTQSRPELIERTFASLRGARRAIVHLYNSTSAVQRRVVFGLDRPGIIEIAVRGARLVRDLARRQPETDWIFQYSPESFSSTELDFACEICDAVTAVWQPSADRKAIINLPATVEMATPNVYADQIEWMHRNLARRESIVLSVHPHNDRGTAVAAAELAMMAGAERIEGTLFGNGERTGNVDIVTLAMNLYTQGVSPHLDFSRISGIVHLMESCTRIPVHPRHPYAGDLVFTAFSGSHQDAIKKGLTTRDPAGVWEVPYLPIDPSDLGRSYESIIRINSQSGKGGVAYLLQRDHEMMLPRRLQIEFSRTVQQRVDESGQELTAAQLWKLFQSQYLLQNGPWVYASHQISPLAENSGRERIALRLRHRGIETILHGTGTGPIDAAVRALPVKIDVVGYDEHACGTGSDAQAAAYVEISTLAGTSFFGVGRHANLVTASLLALISALNRAVRSGSLTSADAAGGTGPG